MIELLLLAALQPRIPVLQIPAIPSQPVVRADPLVSEVTGLPDLTVGGMRQIAESVVEFEVRNRGGAATDGPVRLEACAYIGISSTHVASAIFCSKPKAVGKIAAGESRWVRIECFLDYGGVNPFTGASTGPGCATLGLPGQQSVDAYTAQADPRPDAPPADVRLAARRINENCSLDHGCIQESNERNNGARFEPPFAR